MTETITYETLDPAGLAQEIDGLAEVLCACVASGASVSFLQPFGIEDARSFWMRKVAPGVADGSRRVVIARLDGRAVGTAQLDLGTPPNQPHRADVAKVLVHPGARRRGIARALMQKIERIAQAEGRWLLTLDTVEGSPAQTLYASLGYRLAGIIPHYARAPELTPERFEGTAILYRDLRAA